MVAKVCTNVHCTSCRSQKIIKYLAPVRESNCEHHRKWYFLLVERNYATNSNIIVSSFWLWFDLIEFCFLSWC